MYIDIHARMISCATDDYEQRLLTGCIAWTEPVFRAAFEGQSQGAFAEHLNHLTSFACEYVWLLEPIG